MKKTNIFSSFARFFRSSSPQRQPTLQDIPLEPVAPLVEPPPSFKIIEEAPLTIEEKTDISSAEPVKEKKAKVKIDKKGFPVLTDDHDLYQLFGAEEDKNNEEDFAKLFNSFQDDRKHHLLLNEKKQAIRHSKPLTVGEQIKTYPGPQAELDLHGHTSIEAEAKTQSFISNARSKGIRTVRIIVGKGLHSGGKAVLPDVVEAKVIELKRQKWALDFIWEKKDKRKSGALIVYLIPIY